MWSNGLSMVLIFLFKVENKRTPRLMLAEQTAFIHGLSFSYRRGGKAFLGQKNIMTSCGQYRIFLLLLYVVLTVREAPHSRLANVKG